VNEQPLFDLNHIVLRREAVTILNDLSFTVNRGDTLAVLGPSGAGKTSLLRLLNGMDSPTSGSIIFDNQPLEDHPALELRKNVGMVFQSPVMMKGSVEENLRITERWSGNIFSADKLITVMEHVGLDQRFLSKDAQSLSGGEKQRVALARVLLNEPRVLLLDEPTANLDPKLAKSIIKLFSDLQKELGLTVLISSHNHSLIEKFVNRVVGLIDGKIIEEGNVDVLSNPKTKEVQHFLLDEK